MMGQVAITNVAAQTIAGRKGLRIHRHMMLRPVMKKIAKVERQRSPCESTPEAAGRPIG
jgi:hypothetical protein